MLSLNKLRFFGVSIMVTKEERVVFEYELYKLGLEYQKCVDAFMKSKIKEDISFLQSVLQSMQKRNHDSSTF